MFKARVSELQQKITELETLNTVSSRADLITCNVTDEEGGERKENERIHIQIRELGSVISNMLDDLQQ